MRSLAIAFTGLLLLSAPVMAQTAAGTVSSTVSSEAAKASADAVKKQQDAAVSQAAKAKDAKENTDKAKAALPVDSVKKQ